MPRSSIALLSTVIFFFAPFAQPLMGQVTSTWSGGNGLWPDSAKWTGSVPNGASADAVIDSLPGTNSVVTLGSGFNNVGYTVTLGRLQIDAGDRVELSEVSTNLTMDNSGFSGAGEILMNGTLVLPGSPDNGGSSNTLTGTKTLNGTGKLLLGQPGRRPEIMGNTTNNAIIEGAATFGRVNSGGNAFPIFNAGTVNANLNGQVMEFATFGATNTGTMQATNGGILRFSQGDMNNTGGLLRADGAGSPANTTAVEFGGRFVTVGGILSATAGGLLRIIGETTWKNLTATGPTQVQGILTLDGTVTNNGTITISAVQARLNAPYNPGFDPAKIVTLAGTGEVILDKAQNQGDTAFADLGTLWLIQDQTIRGRGSFGRNDFYASDRPQVINRGTFQADRAGETFELALGSMDNQISGVLRAKDGGILFLGILGPLLNTGGTIEALTGGIISSTFGRIHGGLVRNVAAPLT